MSRGLAETPPPVLRRVLLRALRAAGGSREIGLEHVEAVTALLGGAQGGRGRARNAAWNFAAGKLVLLQQRGGLR